MKIEGRGVPLRGNDIDTDRIIPARFLKSVRFEGLEEHVFEDDRIALAAAGEVHPFSDPRFSGASILVVNRNFACGSSREHAPQALARWGIRAVVGESFSEIFFSNSVTLGIPCLTAPAGTIDDLMSAIERDPSLGLTVDIASRELAYADRVRDLGLADGMQRAFLTGEWDATGLLLENLDDVRAVAQNLPYVRGF